MYHYSLTLQKFIYNTTNRNKAGLEAAEKTAEPIFKNAVDSKTYTPVDAGLTANSIAPGQAYKLNMDTNSYVSTFKIGHITEANEGPYAIFMEHLPTEFEGAAGHYLKGKNGNDVEPTLQEPDPAAAKHQDKRTGLTILATSIVTFVALIGLFLVMPFWTKVLAMPVAVIEEFTQLAGLFASGCLLATAFMLILPEGFHIMTDQYPGKEAKVNLLVGIFVLIGVLLSPLLSWVFSVYFANKTANVCDTGCKDTLKPGVEITEVQMVPAGPKMEEGRLQKEGKVNDAQMSLRENGITDEIFEFQPKRWTSTAWVVLLGDFAHNFGDGIAIGIAFKACGTSMGWTVTVSAVAHELSQELSDFLVLTSQGGMSPASALAFNLLSGVSCVIGGIVGAEGNFSKGVEAAILAFSAGTYIAIGAVELLGNLTEPKNTPEIFKRLVRVHLDFFLFLF